MTKPRYPVGRPVYHKTNPEVHGMVTGHVMRVDHFTYLVVWGEDREEKIHYEMELTDERTFDTSEE